MVALDSHVIISLELNSANLKSWIPKLFLQSSEMWSLKLSQFKLEELLNMLN